MNITPTTIGKANSMPTKIVVYDTTQKKPVLIFKSITQCVKYLFHHRIFSKIDMVKYHRLIINECCQKRKKEELNIFAIPLTYRYANDNQKEILDDQDYIVLDEGYRAIEYEEKRAAIGTKANYVLENILEVGDLVEINTGRLKGSITEIMQVKPKSAQLTPGNFNYTLQINDKPYDYKANTLDLVKKGMKKNLTP